MVRTVAVPLWPGLHSAVIPAKGNSCITVIPAKAGIQTQEWQVGGIVELEKLRSVIRVTQSSPQAGIQAWSSGQPSGLAPSPRATCNPFPSLLGKVRMGPR